MRSIVLLLSLLAAVWPGHAALTLPASRLLAGPLDDAKSAMGDNINNYPFGNGVGSVNTHGWVSIEFSPSVEQKTKFRLRWHAIGEAPLFVFASGHYLHINGEQNTHSPIQISQGELNLDTGEVTNLDVHAIFQNGLIQKSAKYDRLPSLVDGDSFTALFLDFPPLEFPFELPFKERPPVFQTARFIVDASQRITGFEFHGTTFIPITVLPKLGIMPPYAFGRKGVTFVPGTEGCVPGGPTPDSACLSESSLPDGIAAADNAYLAPSLHLVTSELREITNLPAIPPAHPSGPFTGGAAANLSGRLYVTGGSDGQRTLTRASFYEPTRNEWTNLPDMPHATWQHCAVAVGGKVYAIGGRDGFTSDPANSLQIFDAPTRAWTVGTPIPAATADAACAVLDSRIYVFGGATPTAPSSDAAWVFDTASARWSALPQMPMALAGSAVATSGREIWVINGTSDGLSATDRVLVYSPDSSIWSDGPPSARAVYEASAASLEGRIYVTGGRTAPRGPLDVGGVLYESQMMQTLAGGVWGAGLYQPLAASGMAGAVIGDTWYLVGGDTAALNPAAPTAVAQAFAASRDWVMSDTYPVFTAQTVRNAAGLGTGPAELAPGALASILGANLTDRTVHAPLVSDHGQYLTTDLPEELGGIRITIDSKPAGIVSVSPKRIDFQVPFETSTAGSVTLKVSRQGVEAPPVQVRMAPSAPGIFTYTYGETRALDILKDTAAIVTNSNGTLNYPSQPAHLGETVTLRVTGLGDVSPRPSPLERGHAATVIQIPEVLIDGRSAPIQTANLVPGEAGVYEVRVTIPSQTRVGRRVSLALRSNGILSNSSVFVTE